MTLEEKLRLHAELMPVDPRLKGLTITHEIIGPRKKFPYTQLVLKVYKGEGDQSDEESWHKIAIPFNKRSEESLTQPEGFLIARLFIAIPTLIVWVMQNGMAGLGAFMYTKTPEDAMPARESDLVMFGLMSLDGGVPA